MFSFSQKLKDPHINTANISKDSKSSHSFSKHRSHTSKDFSTKSSNSKLLLNDLNSYITSISQEYSANFSIIYSNLLEFKVMLEALYSTSNSSMKEILKTLPSNSSAILFQNKKDCKKIFIKIFKFLDKFLRTLSDFSLESETFDKFSEIAENTSSVHNISDDDMENELTEVKKENEKLKKELVSYRDRVGKVSEYCEELVREVEVHRDTSERLKMVVERLGIVKEERFGQGEKKIEFGKITAAFEKHLNALSKKIVEREGKIDDLENKYEDFEDLKAYNHVLYQEVNKIATEYEKIKKTCSETEKKLERLERESKSMVDQKEKNEMKKEENSKKSESRLPIIKNSNKVKEVEASALEKANRETQDLKREIENYKQLMKSLSTELEVVNSDQMLDKIIEIKAQSNSTYFAAERISETLNELVEHAGVSEGRLLSYIQENERMCKKSCTELFVVFEKITTKFQKNLETKIAALELKTKKLIKNYKKNVARIT